MEDQEIVALYWAREEEAITATDEKYGKPLHRTALRILAVEEDAEECVNDTYWKAWSAIPPTRPQKLFPFLAKICRNLALDRLDWKTAKIRQAEVISLTQELEECISAGEGSCEMVMLGDCLNRFLRGLPDEQRMVFLRRYWFGDAILEIGTRYDFSQSKVKSMLARTRNKLKEFLWKEGIFL